MAEQHLNRVVWVTGGASGIGQATIEEIVAEGGRVVGSDLPSADFSWAKGNDSIAVITGDVRDPIHNTAAVKLAIEHFSRLDGAVLNAGIAHRSDLLEGSLEQFDRTMEVNVRGVVLGIQTAAKVMQPGSAITVTASTSGLLGDPGMWIYNTSKAAIINLVRSTAMDLASRGVRVNAVCPGPIETGMTERIKEDEPTYEALRKRIPMQRWGLATEVAAAHSWLLSTKASFITGAYIQVDGGIGANTGQFMPQQFSADTESNIN